MVQGYTISCAPVMKYAPTHTASQHGFIPGTLRDALKLIEASRGILMHNKIKGVGEKKPTIPQKVQESVETTDESLLGFSPFFTGNSVCQTRSGREAFSCLPAPQPGLRKLLLEVQI